MLGVLELRHIMPARMTGILSIGYVFGDGYHNNSSAQPGSIPCAVDQYRYSLSTVAKTKEPNRVK